MSEHNIPAANTFCWNELSTNDLDAAKKFYTDLLGWTLHTSETAGMGYTEIEAAGRRIGGMYQQTPECGPAMPPHWMAYVAVDDVDGLAARVADLGGKVCVGPMDIPNVGRFAVINDPTGAVFSIIKLSGAHD
jgi:predicted enzyme related to lactoylglutathione lyase